MELLINMCVEVVELCNKALPLVIFGLPIAEASCSHQEKIKHKRKSLKVTLCSAHLKSLTALIKFKCTNRGYGLLSHDVHARWFRIEISLHVTWQGYHTHLSYIIYMCGSLRSPDDMMPNTLLPELICERLLIL